MSNRVNVGFFESVVWTNKNNRGFDFSFVNPIIFYRSVEFGSSSKSGNALLGITTKYKWNSQINFYGQFLLDEFSLGDMKNGDNSWRNKFAYQLGAKYYNAFNIQNLLLQIEYNHIRPYVYSHSEVITNYGHNNQSLGHQWGGNAKEILTIARYYKGRYFANAKLQYGIRGLDFNTTADVVKCSIMASKRAGLSSAQSFSFAFVTVIKSPPRKTRRTPSTVKRRLAKGDRSAPSARAKSAVPSPMTGRPGRNLSVAGFGVSSVWINMAALRKNDKMFYML